MRYCGECGAELDPAPVRRRDGEMRVLSIVFCDLVGSTARSARLDPEELRDLVRTYHAGCRAAVEELGGRIIQFLGDGVLATFGSPPVLEDSSRRAVEAALEMVRATARVKSPDGLPVEARAAVHTGTVVLSHIGEGAAARHLDLIGEAANVAARLQAEAAPGGVIVSQTVADSVAGHFLLNPIGEITLKGVPEPIGAYEVVAQTAGLDRLSARAVVGALSPFVGREAEHELLLRRCREAMRGEPQIAVLVGEGGIGKSRLVREVRRSPELATARSLVLRGAQDRATTPFGPVIALLASGAHGEMEVPDEVAELLTTPVVAETPETRRQRTIDAICEWICGLARSEMLLVLVEDLHWVDPSTFEAIGELHARAAGTQLAVLATSRPPFAAWPMGEDLTVMQLDRLSDEAITELLTSLGVADLEPLRRLVDRAEGVPLYLEEIAALAARGESLEQGQVPLTIAELLSSRLEATGDSALAADCSVLGMEVEVALAADVLEITEDALRSRLDRFVQAGVMRPAQAGRTYRFRHGLLRDAAYGMLLRSDRSRLHAAAARALLERHQGERFEEIARHFDAAGEAGEAWQAWERAGEHAASRSAFVEAAAFYDAALESVRRLPEALERTVAELTLAIAAAGVAYRQFGGGSVQAAQMNALSQELADRVIAEQGLDRGTRLSLLATLCSFYSSRPDYRRAAELTPELARYQEEGGSGAVVASLLEGVIALMRGEEEIAERALSRCLEMYDPNRRQLAHPDAGVAAAASLAHLAMGRGSSREAGGWIERAFDYLSHHDEPFSRGWLLLTAAKIYARSGDRSSAHEHAVAARELALERGFEQIEPQARALLAWSGQEDPDDASLEQIRAGIRDMERSGSRSDSSLPMLLLVRSLLELGRGDEARSAFSDLLGFCEETGEWIYRREITDLGRRLGLSARSAQDLAGPAPPLLEAR
jgi:class 3 adenylate cyclase/tetratricopeptide (TPR) repeat protein